MDKLLARHYGEAPVNPLKKKTDYVSVQSSIVSPEVTVSKTEKGKRKLLPLLIYWAWDNANVATLNPNIPLANLNTSLISYANSKGLREKLNGRKIELSIDSIPHLFEIEEKGWDVFLLLYHVGSDVLTINPVRQNIVVPYKIWQNNSIVKNGTLTVEDHSRVVSKKFLQFSNKWIHNYLDGYDERVKTMSKELVDQLILEL